MHICVQLCFVKCQNCVVSSYLKHSLSMGGRREFFGSLVARSLEFKGVLLEMGFLITNFLCAL